MSGISVEVLPDSGAPQVGVTVDGLAPATTSRISIDVSWDDGQTWHGVRGGQDLEVVGGVFVRDHAAPLNVASTYRLTVHAGSTIPDTLTATITVPSATGWLQDPLSPRTAVAIRTGYGDTRDQVLMYGALAAATWAQPMDLAVPQGASLPVASVGQRVAAGAVPLTVSHDLAAEGGALRRLLMTSGQLVVRGLPSGPLEAVAHVVVGDAQEVRTGPEMQISTWDLTASQVRPQSLRIVVPWWTYEQVQAMWAGETYDEVLDARPGDTYLDWQRSPEVP